MKRSILFLLILGLTILHPSAQAQQFAPVGAFWCYTGSSSHLTAEPLETAKWTDTVRSEKDTFVNSVACRKITVHKRELRINNNDTFSSTANYYLYDNADTVFIYSNYHGNFVPLYVFSVAVADTVCLPIPFPEFADNKTSYCFKVDSIVTEDFDNIPFKSIYVTTILEVDGDTSSVGFGMYSNDDFRNHGRYTERLGGSTPYSRLFSLIPTATYYDGAMVIHPRKVAGIPYGLLTRYSDSQHNITLSQNDCDFIGAGQVGIEESAANNSIVIYPNPTSGKVFIRSDYQISMAGKIEIKDYLGRTVQMQKWPAGQNEIEISLETLSKGLYIIELIKAEKSYRQKLSIQ